MSRTALALKALTPDEAYSTTHALLSERTLQFEKGCFLLSGLLQEILNCPTMKFQVFIAKAYDRICLAHRQGTQFSSIFCKRKARRH